MMLRHAKTQRRLRMNGSQRQEMLTAFGMILPALTVIIVFSLIPVINAIFISLSHWDLINDMQFVGLRNFCEVFESGEWWDTLLKTLRYVLSYVPCLYVVSLGLALVVKHTTKCSGVFRTAFFSPIVISGAAAGIIWKLLYDNKRGAINGFIRLLGGMGVPWLANRETAFVAVIILSVWSTMGINMVIFLAGLQDIPKDYYEAARVDGANGLQTFFSITLPSLRNTSVYILIMSCIGSFQAYDSIKLLTDGGPANSTRLVVQYIYERAFNLYEMGSATAMSLVLFVLILLVTLLQLNLNKNLQI